MPPFPNLISESLLVRETIQYLKAAGGSASAVRVVDRVMKIRKVDPTLAVSLISDLIDRDPRLMLDGENVEFLGDAPHPFELDETDFVVLDLETTGAKAPPSRIIEIGAYRVRNGEMPPKGLPAPPVDQREQFINFATVSVRAAACTNSAMPGPSPARRMNRVPRARLRPDRPFRRWRRRGIDEARTKGADRTPLGARLRAVFFGEDATANDDCKSRPCDERRNAPPTKTGWS